MTEMSRWVPWFLGAWFAFLIIASVAYRRAKGKAIWARDDPDALFVERGASKNPQQTPYTKWYRKNGGAANSLVVVVTRRALVVRPFFPFNLMFFPEVLGLDHTIPLGHLRHVERKTKLRKPVVDVEYEDDAGERQRLTLILRRTDAFLDALDRARRAAGPPVC